MKTTIAERWNHFVEAASKTLGVNAGTIGGSHPPLVCSTKDAAEFFARHPGTIRRWCAEGILKATKGGPGQRKDWGILEEEIERLFWEGCEPVDTWDPAAPPPFKLPPRPKRRGTGAKMGVEPKWQKYRAKAKALILVVVLAVLAVGILRLCQAT